MPYDKELDKAVFEEGKEFGNTKIVIGAYSYNNAEAKLQIAREFKNADGQWQYSKLGRLTKEEIQGVLPIISSAVEKM
ncbi:MAG: hypothetical protein KAU12_03040 [Candidatus Omnitrophica bacterium]|nr:hypothetical protein [Candidatus Omnitrophota bacterium]